MRNNLNRMSTRPLGVPRTRRSHNILTLQPMPAGKCVPVAAIPLLREDGVRSGVARLSFEMAETHEMLLNAINVRTMVYFVPTLAFERFNGSMDILNRSYKGQPPMEGEDVIPFIHTEAFGTHGSKAVYKALGVHGKPAQSVNTAYLEAYNCIFNYRATQRSKDIEHRTAYDATLAPAFWAHERFRHIVADVDLASMDGEVPLNVVNTKLNVMGVGVLPPGGGGGGAGNPAAQNARQSDGQVDNKLRWVANPTANSVNGYAAFTMNTKDVGGQAYPDVWAELEQNGITVSLSNIEMAKKVKAFARLRQQFAGHDDDWIIDLLMSGIQIPDQALKQPMLLADRSTVFGMQQRYASDAENLTVTAVNGGTYVDLRWRLPRVTTGGVIMIIAEITPDQLFERQADPYFFATSVEEFPEYVRDSGDPEPVTIVKKSYIDVDHDDGDDRFGYMPLNAQWFYDRPRIGGTMYRPEVDEAVDEDRLRIWANEVQNPTLNEDFFLCGELHLRPFINGSFVEPFEVACRGTCLIEGNTFFGPGLIEAGDDYDKVMQQMDQSRIDKTIGDEEEEE